MVRQVNKDTGADTNVGTPGSNRQRHFTLTVEGSDSLLTCTIGNDASSCTSATTDTLAAGRRVAIHVETNGSGTLNSDVDALVTWECSGP